MSIRSILVPLSGTDSDGVVLGTAAQVAVTFDGHIDALYARSAPQFSPTSVEGRYDTARMQEFLQQFNDEIEANSKTAEANFKKILDQHQINICKEPQGLKSPSASWQIVSGLDANEINERGRAYDLIVVGGRSPNSGAGTQEIIEAALFGTGRPVLIAPGTTPEKLGETVLVGWNKTIQSARAVSGMMPFLDRAKRVIVFTVATDAKQGPSVQEVARTLAWSDIEAEVKEVRPEGRRVGQILLEEAKQSGADLLVMGAYSHSRWREMILGGVTRYVLEHADIPVLMAH
jgi:nucleotide-binding universal stress UspA family protein